MLKGVNMTRGAVGPNVSGSPFKVCGLLTTGVAVVDGLELGEVYILRNVEDARALGLDEDYDIGNNVVVFQHIVDYYDEDENIGLPLYLLVAPQEVEVDEVDVPLTIDMLVDVANAEYAKKLIIEAEGAIYKLGVSFNPPVGYTDDQTDGMNSDVRAAISKAQALWAWSLETDREVQIILEGRAIGGTAASALDLAAIPASPAGIEMDHKVSIVIGQDWEFAETLDGLAQKYAGVGKILSSLSKVDLNQDIGEVETQNLTKETRERWRIAGLSNHVKVKDAETQLATYDAKHYIYADVYLGIPGYRWNADWVCAPVVIDAQNNMNEHSISLGVTMNHTSRELRKQLLLEVRKVKPVDPTSGKLATGAIKYLEGKGNEVFERFVSAGHLVAGRTTVDPDSDVQVGKEVDASFNAVAYSTIAKINGVLNNKSRI